MTEITSAGHLEYEELLMLWEASVRATHDFLSEDDIQTYKKLIANNYMQTLDLYCVREDARIAGFIGLNDNLVQMLFVHPQFRRMGIGKALMHFAINEHNVTEVDVNEQNIQALEFYKTFGFEAFDRFNTDDAGKPYPILSLSLSINNNI
jgi:putative acetyltransferase